MSVASAAICLGLIYGLDHHDTDMALRQAWRILIRPYFRQTVMSHWIYEGQLQQR